MIRNFTRIEYKIGDREFHLYCDPASPTSEVKEVASQIIAHMIQIENQRAVPTQPAQDLPVEDHCVEVEVEPSE